MLTVSLETDRMLLDLINVADVAVCIINASNGRLEYMNNRMAELLRLDSAPVGRNYREVFEAEYAGLFDRIMGKDLPENSVVAEKCYIEAHEVWIHATVKMARYGDGRVMALMSLRDVTIEQMKQQRYHRLAYFDRELRLPNYLKLERDLSMMPSLQDISMICFDIDGLRAINDVYGWHAGNSLLEQIRDYILGLGIENLTLYRVDGDEFCLLVAGFDHHEVDKLAWKIYRRFEKSWMFGQGSSSYPLYCTVTMGIIHGDKIYEQRRHHIRGIITRLLSKNTRTGQLTVYNASRDRDFKQRIKVRQQLIHCSQQNMQGFSVEYQPIVNPATGLWIGLEALCRWDCPDIGRVSPALFIADAERLGLIIKIGDWAMERAISDCKAMGLDAIEGFMLDVNISPLQVNDKSFESKVLELVEKYDYPRSKLCLEITESSEFNFDSDYIRTLKSLSGHGLVVALDDFGTGYCSFNNLKKIPATILKTEKTFIDNIEHDEYLQYLFDTMVRLSHAAGMRIVAEGVETHSQQKLLTECGADYLQGYLYSKPLTVIELKHGLGNFHQKPVCLATVSS